MTVKDLTPALRAFLLADAAISTAVGAARIHPMVLPQDQTTDSIVYTKISSVSELHSEGPDGLGHPRYQIDCWSKTPPGAKALFLLVKNRLEGYRGVMGSGGDAITVQGVIPDNEREGYDSEAKLYYSGQDFIIWFEER